VNQYSVDLGEEGRQAVQLMFDKALDLKLIPETEKMLFLE